MLLDYLTRHERHLEEILSNYEEHVSKRILDCWFSYTPDTIPKECFESCDLDAGMTIDEVIQRAVRLDECLLLLYQEMASRAPHADVRDVFQTLLELERQEEHELVRNALQLKEM
jgi:hypothetical protein